MSDLVLSHELGRLAEDLRRLAARDRVPDPQLTGMVEELELYALLAGATEQELAVFRRLEAGQSRRIAIEAVSVESVLPIKRDGNVVAPDFGRSS